MVNQTNAKGDTTMIDTINTTMRFPIAVARAIERCFRMGGLVAACIVLLALPAGASEQATTGSVALIRIHTQDHPATGVHGYTTLYLSVGFTPPCNAVAIRPEDRNATALILASKFSDRPITVHYLPELPSPWSADTCMAISVEPAW
jgi:hypothetical protein